MFSFFQPRGKHLPLALDLPPLTILGDVDKAFVVLLEITLFKQRRKRFFKLILIDSRLIALLRVQSVGLRLLPCNLVFGGVVTVNIVVIPVGNYRRLLKVVLIVWLSVESSQVFKD